MSNQSGWHKFDDGDSQHQQQVSSSSPTKTSGTGSSGVSSARGSVNSLPTSETTTQNGTGEPGALEVSEIHVVDEQVLKRKSSVITNEAVPKVGGPQSPAVMDQVSLSDDDSPIRMNNIRGKKFVNGEVIVTLLPLNERFPWVTPARFRPELVPEELLAPVLTLTVEEYVQAMEKLTKDIRFSLFNICYKRILVIWIVTAFVILLALLFSGFQGIKLFACGVAWLILNAGAIFLCMWIKLKLNKHMEKCMAGVNANLLKHKLMIAVDDRGKLSCHKVNLCFIYIEPTECIKKLQSILSEKPDENPQNGPVVDPLDYLRTVEDFDDVEVVISGRNSVRVDRKQERAEKLFLHYLQRWGKDYLRRRLDWVIDDIYGRAEYASNTNPRHLATALCPCQYIEEHLRNKRHRESLNPCKISQNPCHWCQ